MNTRLPSIPDRIFFTLALIAGTVAVIGAVLAIAAGRPGRMVIYVAIAAVVAAFTWAQAQRKRPATVRLAGVAHAAYAIVITAAIVMAATSSSAFTTTIYTALALLMAATWAWWATLIHRHTAR